MSLLPLQKVCLFIFSLITIKLNSLTHQYPQQVCFPFNSGHVNTTCQCLYCQDVGNKLIHFTLLHSYLYHYLDVLACMLSYLFMSICTSQTYIFRQWYVINVHIFQLHQSNFILAGKSFLFHIYFVLCLLLHLSTSISFQYTKVHCLQCTLHLFLICKNQSFMVLVRITRAFLPYFF